MAYKETAKEILKEAIKSAVFIDEKALEFSEAERSGETEEKLSLELYTKFKASGVFLEPIRYENGREKDDKWLKYCLDGRDLILLDWHLDGKSGEVQSLKILDRIIKTPNIHFCVIYTSEPELDNVLKRLVTNYSDLEKDKFDEYKEITETIFGEYFKFDSFHNISLGRNNSDVKNKFGDLFRENRPNIQKFMQQASIEDAKCAAYKISTVNLDSFHEELDHPLPCPDYIDSENYLLRINNTFITIFKKEENDPETLLENFFTHVVGEKDSYTQLLTIDFFNRIFRVGVLNEKNKIKFGKNALLDHRENLKKDELDDFYEEFIKELLLEKLSLSLRESKSQLLSEEIFRELNDSRNTASDEDKREMNVFYNSSVLEKENKFINFGDVFEINKEKYLICITPLCDCLRPQEKIKGNYFFALGKKIALTKALQLGDTAFTSFLPNGKVIIWTDVPREESKYVPIYIKPVQFKVVSGKDKINQEGMIELFSLDENGKSEITSVQYVTTIRENYAQRIANHTFFYPLRVGVDFVKGK